MRTNRWADCSLHPESQCQVEEECRTAAGPDPDSPCIFPFTHNGVLNTECTTEGLGLPWCSTRVWPNGTHVSGRGLYGLCSPSCPGGERRCEVGQVWQVQCNTCTCSPSGILSRYSLLTVFIHTIHTGNLLSFGIYYTILYLFNVVM